MPRLSEMRARPTVRPAGPTASEIESILLKIIKENPLNDANTIWGLTPGQEQERLRKSPHWEGFNIHLAHMLERNEIGLLRHGRRIQPNAYFPILP